MREIISKAKAIHELLRGVKCSIDYYQREYRWQGKQVSDLIEIVSACGLGPLDWSTVACSAPLDTPPDDRVGNRCVGRDILQIRTR